LPPVTRIDEANSFGAEIRAGGAVYRIVFPKNTLDGGQVTRATELRP
jgi:hypothetical protein